MRTGARVPGAGCGRPGPVPNRSWSGCPGRTLLTDLLAEPGGPTEDGPTEDGPTEDGPTAALRRRAANPATSRADIEVLDRAGQLIGSVAL
ncbi:hypothetical protein [Streptomyces sp900105755]|uniref:Uncharacterized protein n=1 Tax=Streptomyces sp. 900105755 TaxID=3154389 RepID=A0ABV1T8D6_9ACTN